MPLPGQGCVRQRDGKCPKDESFRSDPWRVDKSSEGLSEVPYGAVDILHALASCGGDAASEPFDRVLDEAWGICPAVLTRKRLQAYIEDDFSGQSESDDLKISSKGFSAEESLLGKAWFRYGL